MKSEFKKYYLYIKKCGKLVDINQKAFDIADEAFTLFKALFDTNYGSIQEKGNLISIHTGGWSENEALIEEFKQTAWWFKNHKITEQGGHYYCNIDTNGNLEWLITSKKKYIKKRKQSHKQSHKEVLEQVIVGIKCGIPIYNTLKKLNCSRTIFYQDITPETKRYLNEIKSLKKSRREKGYPQKINYDSADFTEIE